MQTKNYQFWFCTGSQDLYGDDCLRKVAEHSAKIVEGLNASGKLPFEVVLKPTLISQASIRKTFNDANNDDLCAGVITWMHTFSPAKMWILGLKEFKKLMDSSEVGGTALLGISKPVIKAHGSSDAYAIQNAVRQAKQYISSGIIGNIEENIDLMRLDAPAASAE